MHAEHFFNFKNERPIVFASALATTMTRYPVVTAKKTPQLDTFRDSIGDEGVLRMTHFTPSEIVGLYSLVSDFMSTSLLHPRKMIVHFLELLSPHLYALYAEDAVKADSMEKSY
ncbi:hypothetical protein PRIC1_006433 [Phytophthora ramorum]